MITGTFPEKLQAARMWLLTKRDYVAAILYSLRPVPVDGMYEQAGGMVGVDEYFRLYYDPTRVESEPVATLATQLYHETGHLREKHHDRMRGEPDLAANIAGDCAINSWIREEQGLTWKAEMVLPHMLGLPDKLACEEYIELLKKQCKKGGLLQKHGDCGSASGGQQRSWELGPPTDKNPGVDHAEGDLIRHETAQAIKAAVSRGTVPEYLKQWADSILSPLVPWQQVLARLVRESLELASGRSVYTMRRPNNRSIGVVLPSLRSPQVRVAAVCDTSGSMSQAAAARIIGEINGLLAQQSVAALDRITVDAAVHGIERNVQKRSRMNMDGGGGTDMGVGIEAALELRPRPQIIVVLTDGHTPWPAEKPRSVRTIIVLIGAGCGKPPDWADRAVEVSE